MGGHDRGIVGNHVPDFVHLGIGNGNAAIRPIEHVRQKRQPAEISHMFK
jgi:hypothetical protein